MKRKNRRRKQNWMKWTGNMIGYSGAMKICEALITNTTLTELNLGCDEKDIKWKKKRKRKAREKWNRNERIEEENKMEWNEQGTT